MGFFHSKLGRILAVLTPLVALYALTGFVLAPKMLRKALIENVQSQLGVTASVGDIRINPFLLRLDLRNFSLPDERGAKLVGFERLHVEFQLSSIWHRAIVFGDIEIASPFVHAVVAQDGSLNLLSLRPKATRPEPAPAQKSTAPPSIRVGLLRVTRGLATYEDRSRPSEFAARLEPINFELEDFTTGAAGGEFSFAGTSKLGERVQWHGHLSVSPIASQGEFTIGALQARTIWEYLEDQVGFEIASGTIDFNARYRFSLQDGLGLNADLSKLTVANLGVRVKGSDVDWIVLPNAAVGAASFDLKQREVHLDSLLLSGLKLLAWREADKSINLMRLAARPAAMGTAAPISAVPRMQLSATAPAAANRPWQLELREFDIENASILAQDRSTKPAAGLLLEPLSLRVMGVSLDMSRPINVDFRTRINHSGDLAVSGEVTPQPVAADVRVKFANVELKALQPYLSQTTAMTLLDGRLDGDAGVRVGTSKPAILVTGNVSLADLRTVDDVLHDDFIKWDRLDVLGIRFQQDPSRLSIERITARKPYARVIIEADESLNVKRILAGPRVGLSAAGAAPALPTGAKSTARSRAAAGHPGAAVSASNAMPIAVRRIVFQSGDADFSDLSIVPNFEAGIHLLNGTVTGLSSSANSRARVDLHGQVDAFAPVSIVGEVNVLGPALYTDLALDFRNMELSTFNPYSGKFAGYNITKGKLTTELKYKVAGRQLDAQHHITIGQLEFGEKTESKDAVSLPIKLAVALLKDRNGVIDLDVPVTGSLDDPQFRLGPVIWKVVLNLLVKIVTAPFALLGSLFSGGPDLQFIDFPPGATTLDAAGTAKAKSIAKALLERPQLKLEVPIASVPEIDRPALIEAAFATQVEEQQKSASSGRKPAAGAPPTLDQLEPNVQVELLTKLYEKNLGGAPKFPPAKPPESKIEASAAKLEFLKTELKQHIVVDDAQLKALAEKRAAALQLALLGDTQLDPARVFLVVSDKAKAQNGQTRLELSLQ